MIFYNFLHIFYCILRIFCKSLANQPRNCHVYIIFIAIYAIKRFKSAFNIVFIKKIFHQTDNTEPANKLFFTFQKFRKIFKQPFLIFFKN